MEPRTSFKVLVVHCDTGRSEVKANWSVDELVGGSGLAAGLFAAYARPDAPWDHPDQPLIFAIGPLTGYFPLMSKVVCAFVSPYHGQYAESHAGGRLALALRFAGYEALVLLGRAKGRSALAVGPHRVELKDAHYLWGMDALATGKAMRRVFPGAEGHRSILRIGPAAENGLAYGCINVDTFRHFGRLGAGTVMAAKNLKAIVVQGEESQEIPEGKAYPDLFRKIYRDLTATPMMSKYHDLGTPQNVIPLNELKSLPWRNMTATSDPGASGISGERFAEKLLLRNTACSGCPVGCIHVGMLRKQFADEHQFAYYKVAYDHELVFSVGSMLGVTEASDVLDIIDEIEKQGMDAISAGVALAWATEALQRGVVGQAETIELLSFGQAEVYRRAMAHLGGAANDFYRALGQGTLAATKIYGGGDFACVLGQEMAGYATGEAFFTSMGLGLRHSHLDSGGYAYDQGNEVKDIAKAVGYLVKDERLRCLLTSMVACLFSRSVYKEEVLADCLNVLGYAGLARDLAGAGERVQKSRWKLRFDWGYDPGKVSLPKRFGEIVTWRGPMDADYQQGLRAAYARAIADLGKGGGQGG